MTHGNYTRWEQGVNRVVQVRNVAGSAAGVHWHGSFMGYLLQSHTLEIALSGSLAPFTCTSSPPG